MKKITLLIMTTVVALFATAQCEFIVDEVDDFTGYRTIETAHEIILDDVEGEAIGDYMAMVNIRAVDDVVVLNCSIVLPEATARTLWSIDSDEDIMIRLSNGDVVTVHCLNLTHSVDFEKGVKVFILKILLHEDDMTALRAHNIEKIRFYFSGAYLTLYCFKPDKIKNDLNCIFN